MSLAPRTRIGVYEVVAKVGEGGMGEVYRAHDSKLARDVALKILPEAFAQDAERLARFEREARTLASLNHPHIAHVYGFEQSGASHALVMELVEGEDLSARIRRGPIPLDEAIPLARQIADALEAAHEAGIVHRDLKPANIKVRGDGTVKVLDFGLAKAFESGLDRVEGFSPLAAAADASARQTITSPAMTMRGVILGTAAYMSPEQAKGRYVDKRADIWAFGCVLFEMLTGKRAFDGEDVSDTLASVLRADPDFAALSKHANPGITRLVRRCLARDPKLRMRDIGDVRLQLDDTVGTTTEAPSRQRWSVAAIAGAAVVVLLAAGVPLALRSATPTTGDPGVLRVTIGLPERTRVHRLNSGRYSFALSPDGRKLAAVLRPGGLTTRVFMRRLDDTEFREVAGSENAQSVLWSPDSERFAFTTPQGLKFSSLSGTVSIPTIVLPGYGPTVWGSDDRFVASVGAQVQLHRWPAGGLAVSDPPYPAGVISRQPIEWFADNSALLLTQVVNPGDRPTNEILVVAETPDRRTREITRMDVLGAAQATPLVRAGHLLLARIDRTDRSVLTAQPIDSATLALTGKEVVLLENLNQTVSASYTGVLAYAPRNEFSEELVWVNARGEIESRLNKLQAQNIDLSRDDRFVVMQDAGGIRVIDLQRGVASVLAKGGADPVWSADGRQVAYVLTAPTERGIHVIPAFGGPSRLVFPSEVPLYIDDWSTDGQWFAAHTNRVNTTSQKGEGMLVPAAGGKPLVFGDTTGNRGVDEGRFSPDGKWLAFGLTAPDGGDVFVMPVPPTGERWQVSVAGGGQPRWSRDGKSLFYLAQDGSMMSVAVAAVPGAPPAISPPRRLFQTGLAVSVSLDQYAVSRDGTRFLLRRPEDTAAPDEIRLIVNWPELLKSK